MPAIHLSPYNFRHAFATRAAQVLPPKTLQYLMGHGSPTLTLKFYIGIVLQDVISAVSLLEKI